MKPIVEMSMAELAAYVSTHLRQKGISVVLSGGACVSLFSDNQYQSADIDLINEDLVRRRVLRDAMQELGFREERRYYSHPATVFLVEFPAGPLSVGEEPVGRIVEMHFSTGILRTLSPTDCVKDRLAGFYHWQDRQCLAQAVMVAAMNPVDLAEVERWSVREGFGKVFQSIRPQLAGDTSRGEEA